jgi:hypothetical protein
VLGGSKRSFGIGNESLAVRVVGVFNIFALKVDMENHVGATRFLRNVGTPTCPRNYTV